METDLKHGALSLWEKQERSSESCCDFSFFSNSCLQVRRNKRVQPKVIMVGNFLLFDVQMFVLGCDVPVVRN